MEKQCLRDSTCIVDVDLRCCTACPLRVKKKLQKITGVNSIRIDVEKGNIEVRGEVDPPTIINSLTELGKRSELSSFRKNPTPTNVTKRRGLVKKNTRNSQAGSNSSINQNCGCNDCDSDSDSNSDDDDDDAHVHENKNGHHNNATIRSSWNNKAPLPTTSPIVYGNGGLMGENQSMRMPYGGGIGNYTPPMLPVPPPHGLYSSHHLPKPPVGNSVFHIFSDDNTTSQQCIIM